ncbi:MAG: T9SS type A sorting domain-containing protein [Bacteroidota bacterium]
MSFAPPLKQTPFFILFAVLLVLLTASFSPEASGATRIVTNPRIVDVSVDSPYVGVGEVFEVAINVNDVSGLGITAFNLALTYDASLLTASAVAIEGTMSGTANMTLVYNADDAGRIAIAAAGVDALAGAGGLVIITFESLATDGISSLVFEAITFNEGNPAATGNDGSVTVTSALAGDASLNGEVSAFDAAMVLQHAAFIDTLSTPSFIAADVSGNSEVSSFDAALILQRVSGLVDCFPVDGGCASKHQGDQVIDAAFSWGPVAPDGMLVHIPLILDHVSGSVHALTFEIIASEEIDFTSDIRTRLPEGWIVSRGENAAGHTHITMAGLTPLSADTLLILQTGADAAIKATARLNEQTPQVLDAPALDAIPTQFALQQNYPNPFNPVTTIQYAIEQDVEVTLVVYDMLGREVERLVDGLQNAGTHNVSFNAQALSSGMYVYRLVAGSYAQTKQMLLVK